MVGTPAPPVYRRTIRCTEANAAEFRQLIKSDEELQGIVQQLQAQDMFPGLRAVSVTISGDEATLQRGLQAWPAPSPTVSQQAQAGAVQHGSNGAERCGFATASGCGSFGKVSCRGCAEALNSARLQPPRIGNSRPGQSV